MVDNIENKINGGCPFNGICLDITGLTPKVICIGEEGNYELCPTYVDGLNTHMKKYLEDFMLEAG